jgi:DNA-binding MarR family transcriptional regulator
MYIHLFCMESAKVPTLPCLCANIRRVSRAITQRYDEALRAVGLTITQYTILQALSLAGEITQGRLGEILAMDSTTLTRTLGVMDRQGWVAKVHGTDRRERRLRLTRAGRSELRRAVPCWEKSQGALRSQLGQERWDNVMKLMNDTASLIAEEGGLDGTAV